MKITDAQVIQSGEKELIDIITGDLDWEIIEKLLENKYNLLLADDDIEYKTGDIVVHDNQVAYKLDFEIKVNLSVLFDRQGECFDVVCRDTNGETADHDPAADPAPAEAAGTDADRADEPDQDDVDRSAAPAEAPPYPDTADNPTPSQIAEMISDINRS